MKLEGVEQIRSRGSLKATREYSVDFICFWFMPMPFEVTKNENNKKEETDAGIPVFFEFSYNRSANTRPEDLGQT